MLEAEITTRARWLSLEGEEGVTFVPLEDVSVSPAKLTFMNKQHLFSPELTDLYVGIEVERVTIISGYGVRASHDGSGDSSPWEVYGNIESARAAYEEVRFACSRLENW